jgi:hypothetical protein
MMRRPLLLALVALCGCRQTDDIVGPFDGITYRFVVDQVVLPMQRQDFADDLNGDERTDDQLGNIASSLAGQHDLTTAFDDLLGSGAFAPVVEIITDDPAMRNDSVVGVRFIGRDGEVAAVMGGSLSKGVLFSNRDRTTRHPVSGTIHLPLYEHADPLELPAIGLEVDLQADATGFTCTLHGAFPSTSDMQPAWLGFAQMVAANPREFPVLLPLFDTDGDGTISFDEFASNGLVQNVLSPDVQLTDGRGHWGPTPSNSPHDSLSFGFWLHLIPCASGTCHAPATNTCQDRVHDGDESDVDCGGSCLSCPGGAQCNGNLDCQSQHCVAGVCTAPGCGDGALDGNETDVDCGGYRCAPCAAGKSCRASKDCITGCCVGSCLMAACNDGFLNGCESDVDCGGPCPRCTVGKTCYSDSDCVSGSCKITIPPGVISIGGPGVCA